jgi:hypothetical protein
MKGLSIKTEIFQHNFLVDAELPKSMSPVDVVITDLPYGNLVNWIGFK